MPRNHKDKEKKVIEVKKGPEYGDELNTIIENKGSDGWGQQTKDK